jgi:hypothetical protein
MESRGFQIFRKACQSDDELDSFIWKPPKHSDELHDALRIAFPQWKTHRERMREAHIEFLVHECETGKRTHDITNLAESKMPTKAGTGISKVPNRKRAPKDWDGMTVVWTRKDGVIRTPGSKRVMTDQERADYRSRRAQGACAICKKRKKKVLRPEVCPPNFR